MANPEKVNDGTMVVITLPMVPRAAFKEFLSATSPGMIPKITIPMINTSSVERTAPRSSDHKRRSMLIEALLQSFLTNPTGPRDGSTRNQQNRQGLPDKLHP